MALAVPQTAHTSPLVSGSPTVVTLASATTVGNVLVAIVNSFGPQPTLGQLTDSRGNTWVLDYVSTDIGFGLYTAAYSTVITNAGTPHTVTYAIGGAIIANVDVAEVSGMMTTGRRDIGVLQTGTSVPPYTAGPTGPLGQTDEIVFASVGIDTGEASATLAQDPGWVLIGEQELGTGYVSSVVYKVVAAPTSTSHIWTGTYASAPWMTVAVSYRAAAVAPVGQISINEAPDVVGILGTVTAPSGFFGSIAMIETIDVPTIVGTFTAGTNIAAVAAMTEVTDIAAIVGTITNPVPIFRYPKVVSGRKIVDQLGGVILIKDISSWGMAQNLSNAEITEALEGAAARHFNVVITAMCGAQVQNDWSAYTNKAGQAFFTGQPWASPLGPAWSSVDWIVTECTRLGLTACLSAFVSYGSSGSAPGMEAATDASMQSTGALIGARYASVPNLMWHVEADMGWEPTNTIGQRLDALFHGIKLTEGGTPRLIIAEPYQGGSSYEMFIAKQADHGYVGGYQWLLLSTNGVYDYGAASTEQFDRIWNWSGATTYPVWDTEPPYVGAGHYPGNYRQQVRERNFATIIRGGVGLNWGHESWWPFGKTGLFFPPETWQQVPTTVEAFDAQYAWDLLDAHCADVGWAPTDALVTTGTGTGDTKAAAGMGSTSALAYFPTNRAVTVNTTQMPGTGNVRLRWFDPVLNTYADIATTEAQTAGRVVSYPANHADGSSDYVLVIDLAGSVTGTVGMSEATDVVAIVGTVTTPTSIAAVVAAVEAIDVLTIVGTINVGPVSGVIAAVEADDAALIVAYQPSAPTTEGGLGVTVSNRTPTLRVTVTPRGNA